MVLTRIATMLLSGSTPTRTAMSMWSLTELDILVGQHHVHVDLGKARQKIGDDWQHVQAPKNDRRRDDKLAPWRAVLPDASLSASTTCLRIRLQAAT